MLVLDHRVKRDALDRFRGPVDLIDILARQKPLGNNDRKIVSSSRQSDRKHQGRELVAKRDLQATIVDRRKSLLPGFKEVVEPAVPDFVAGFQEAAAKHRRE